MARTARPLLVLVVVLLGLCGHVSAAKVASKKAKFWPFTSWNAEEAPKPKVTALRVTTPAPTVGETKLKLLSSEVFMKKTAVLCQNANADDQANCEKVAGERLFCTMFTRHEEKFKGMQGEEEQKQRCSQTDIMTTAAEQAKNEREEEEALKN
eukprot:gnl/TRDRNA2_/TRDRNA2_83945_c0_seq3.p2 gnl/TRDRNA2_/TRDRNA2_83945_c0~~gnl/TRDRNA2_/TRDRNA2_83945_c0_seq3.p2  ORF type:complete len:153 (+),score=43.53 gnl/TRDRNA2_/TRDRNA2_83945_c0_seq3:71-529(+)